VEITRSLLNTAERANPVLHAFLRLAPERAMAQARLAEQRLMAGMRLGPLDGIPIAHKDNFDTADIETTANSARYRGRVPARDAAVVAALTQAGAVTLGKAACYESAFAGPDPDLPWPPPRNPWGLDHSTAGSSSGSAVAIAAGLVLGATGSDTGGSLRDPAALCGVTGLKPRYGSVPSAGMFPFAPSLDTAGPMARTARDAAIMLQAMQPEAIDYAGWIDRPTRGLRIGVVPRWCEEAAIADDVGAVLAEATAALRSAGAIVTSVELPALGAFQACGWTIAMAELLASHSRAVAEDDGDGFGAMLRRRLAVADTIPAYRYIAALRQRDELSRAVAGACADVDVLLLPAQDDVADLIGDVVGSLPFEKGTLTLPFCVTGTAAIVIPGGLGKNGLPIGIQLAACGDEATMLRAACALERDLGGHWHRPPMALAA
jgi:aspartyl-tRNA(Asn)/glutamyl-tRNA(Gln) amidotransferase subunit A